VIFGSADGWVYCVRADDGKLIWRYRAGPEDRRMAAFGQLESVWPVHGSVLVRDDIAYFAAGRSSHLDGGIRVTALDAATGKLRYRTTLAGPSYTVDNIKQNYLLPMGALPDILQSVGPLIFMRSVAFNAKLEQQKGPAARGGLRLTTKAGFLDDSYFKRIPWTMSAKGGGYARLIVHDETTAYNVRMFDSLQGLDPKVYFTPGKKGYLLFAVNKQTGKQTWSHRIAIRATAMVATEGMLVVAGPPDVVDPKDPLGAFEGRKGGVLAVYDSATGKKLSECKLPSPPVFNGAAAANGRLYLALQDGSVACFGK
jgi:outer membrane protein assembly factor BamB